MADTLPEMLKEVLTIADTLPEMLKEFLNRAINVERA
jgi:hypothetical protein